MKQLGGMDATFLNMETGSMYGHVSSMTIFEPQPGTGGAGLEITKRAILSRIDQLEPYRRRLVTVPFGLDIPYWIEDPDFDIDYHVRHHAVPPPGTPQQLARGRQSHHLAPARPPPTAVGALRHRGSRERQVHRPAEQDPPRDHRRRRRCRCCWARCSTRTRTASPPRRRREWWPVEQLPSAVEMLSRTAREYVRRPEKMIRLGIHAVRSMAATTHNPGLAVLG